MKRLLDSVLDFHLIVLVVVAVDADVDAGHDALPNQLPNVQLVNVGNPGFFSHNFGLQFFNVDVIRHSLEQDHRALLQQRNGRGQDQDDDEQGQSWVHVVLVLEVCLPNDDRGHDDGDRPQGVSQNVQKHPLHVQILGRLFVRFRGLLDGQRDGLEAVRCVMHHVDCGPAKRPLPHREYSVRKFVFGTGEGRVGLPALGVAVSMTVGI